MLRTLGTENVNDESQEIRIEQLLGLIAAAGGIFLLSAYVSGRIYLVAFFQRFGVQVSDLDMNTQDVMFESWRIWLPLAYFALGIPAEWLKDRRAGWEHMWTLVIAALAITVVGLSLMLETLPIHQPLVVLVLTVVGFLVPFVPLLVASTLFTSLPKPDRYFLFAAMAATTTLLAPALMGVIRAEGVKQSDSYYDLQRVVLYGPEGSGVGWAIHNDPKPSSDPLGLLGYGRNHIILWDGSVRLTKAVPIEGVVVVSLPPDRYIRRESQ